MEKISVFLADWQVLFREGIHFTLSGEEDIEVIGEATDNEEVLNFIETHPPRVAILNADRSGLTNIGVTRRIKHNFPSVSVITTVAGLCSTARESLRRCSSASLRSEISRTKLWITG